MDANRKGLGVGSLVVFQTEKMPTEGSGPVTWMDSGATRVRDRNGAEIDLTPNDFIKVIVPAPSAAGAAPEPTAGPQAKATPRAHVCKVCGCILKDGNVRRQLCDVCRQARKLEMQRVWRAKQGKVGRPRKACKDCGAEYQATSNLQRYCAGCGAIRLKARESKYRQAAAAKLGSPSRVRKPQGKPAGSTRQTAAPQDNPQGGMTIVERPRAHAPSAANLDPYERALTSEPPATLAPVKSLALDLRLLAAECARVAARVQALSEAIAG